MNISKETAQIAWEACKESAQNEARKGNTEKAKEYMQTANKLREMVLFGRGEK